MNNPSISVLMPVYNAGQYLDESISSILKQSYTNFEFLIFNDGSTDNSVAVIEKYLAADSRIKLFDSRENKGYLVHLNEGLRIAKGEFIARMDSDDISMPSRFEKQIKRLTTESADIIGSNVILWNGNKKYAGKKSRQALTHTELETQMFFGIPVYHPAVLFKREMVDNGDYYYDGEFYPAEDYELWSRLLRRYRFANIKEPLLCYRVSSWQISNQKKTVQQNNAFRAKCNYIVSITGSALSPGEESVLNTFFYNNQKAVSSEEMDILFGVFKRIIENLKDAEQRFYFAKYLLENISYLSSRKNKFSNKYFEKGFGEYYNGTITTAFRSKIRQLLK